MKVCCSFFLQIYVLKIKNGSGADYDPIQKTNRLYIVNYCVLRKTNLKTCNASLNALFLFMLKNNQDVCLQNEQKQDINYSL